MIWIASFFKIGFLPKAPGTWGSLAALPLIYWTSQLAISTQFVFWTFVFVLGTWASYKALHGLQDTDPGWIVIDEVIGQAIAAATAFQNPLTFFAAFLLFRFFDIKKLPPVGLIDRWSKTSTGWKAGLGIMLDDVIAGVQALIVVLIAQKLGYLP